MGVYVTSSEVLALRAVSITGVDEGTVDILIDGVEAQINTILKAQGYIVPVTGVNDIQMIKAYVLRKTAADSHLAARGSDDLPGWVEEWLKEFEQWLEWIVDGTIALEDQDPVHPGRKARRNFVRVLPKVEDDA